MFFTCFRPLFSCCANSLIALGVVWLALVSSNTLAADVQGIRLYRAPDNTRIVFDLTAAVENTVTQVPKTTDKPEQVIIDISQAALGAQVPLPDIQGTPVSHFAVEKRNEADLHVVLELSSSVRANSFLLPPNAPYGHRLVIDLADTVPVTGQAPVQPTASVAPNGRDILIVVDAGHGGEDPGASGPRGVHEKDVTLKIARELASVINQKKGYRAHLTRSTDYFIPLQGRSKIAVDQKADLFVSIHADACRDRAAQGASVFAWSQRGATSTMAKFLADDENLSDLMGGAAPDQVDDVVAKVVADLSIDGNVSYSRAMGRDILDQLGRMAHLHTRHVEQAGFMVLKSVRVPSLLIETGFISNPVEENRLNSTDYEHQLAVAIFGGINKHFMRVPPPDTYIASLKGTTPAATASHQDSANNTATENVNQDVSQQASDTTDNTRVIPPANPARKASAQKTAVRPVVYVVKRGDNLSDIADRYHVTVAAIKKANKLKRSTVLVGQRLKIPA